MSSPQDPRFISQLLYRPSRLARTSDIFRPHNRDTLISSRMLSTCSQTAPGSSSDAVDRLAYKCLRRRLRYRLSASSTSSTGVVVGSASGHNVSDSGFSHYSTSQYY